MKKLLTFIIGFSFTLAIIPAHVYADNSFASELVIQAINPGYPQDGQANAGEFIELRNLSSSLISLAGFSIYYTNSNGNRSNLIEFPEGSRISGEASILLRLASSTDSANADILYNKTLAMSAGPLELTYQNAVVDSICWNGTDGCLAKFSKTEPTTIVRTSQNTYIHQADYAPDWTPGHSAYTAPVLADAEETLPSRCRGLQFSELLSYYEESKTEQFIELFNSTDETMNLNGCAIFYKKKTYYLSGILKSGEYFIKDTKDFTLTKNPTSFNTLLLLDSNGEQLDALNYPHGQKKSASYALFGYDKSGRAVWKITYSPTPGTANTYQEFKSCPTGKIINETTGNCVKITTLTPIKDCPAGKYRNPATGRCKKIEDDSGPTPCKEGYERNPETNRCRKIKNNTGANYAVVPETGGESKTFAAIGALIAIILIGVVYMIFQFRHEICRFLKRLLRRQLKD